MKLLSLVMLAAAGLLVTLGCVQEVKGGVAAGELGAEKPSDHSADVDPVLLKKVQPFYPAIRLKRRGSDPFFSTVEEVARVRLRDGRQRLVVWVHVIVPAMVDHGWGELLIFADARDALPIVRAGSHPLSIVRGSEIHLIENRWLRFGASGPFVSLLDDKSLKHFGKHGLGRLIRGLSVAATRKALDVYLKEGREAFLKLAPIAKHQQRYVPHLPGRISSIEIYPSLAQDHRYSGFKYSGAWEATLLVRLTPADEPQKPIILEIGARASSGGITSEDVELLLWAEHDEEPTDRPAPRGNPRTAAAKP